MSWRFPRSPQQAPIAPDRSTPPPDDESGAAPEVAPDDAEGGSPIVSDPRPPDPTRVSVMPPAVVPRWVQLVLLPIGLLALWALVKAAGSVLLVLIIASLVALVLNPVVHMLERRRLPRGLAILLIYVGVAAGLTGLGIALAQPISTQVSRFSNDVPRIVDQANKDLDNVQRWLLRNGINVHFEKQGQTALQTLQRDITKRSGDIASFARNLVGQIVTISFDLVLILVLSIYLLVYGKSIGRLVRRIMPPGDGTPEDDFPTLVQRAVFGYVRGQLLFSLIMGASAAFALWIFGLLGIFPDGGKYAIFFGAFYGLMEFIPYVGPIIGPVPAVVVALFDNPITALWVVLLFVGLQQLEGHIVAPQVFRISLRINPILIILALLLGYQLYGIIGALVALPLASVIRQTVVYLRRHLVFEPWSVKSPLTDVIPLGPDRCPDCGATAAGGDAFCRSCGASLEPRVSAPR